MEMKYLIKLGLILISLVFIYLFISIAMIVIPQWYGTHATVSPTTPVKGSQNISSKTPRDPPLVLGPLKNQTVIQGNYFKFTLNKTDLKGRILKYEAGSLPRGAYLDSGNDTIAWTPSVNQSGIFAIHLTARNQSLLANQTLFVTVKGREISPDPANMTLKNFLDSFNKPVVLPRSYPAGVTEEDLHVVHQNESIQAAVDKAKNGDTVIVQAGIYPEHVIVNKHITLWGQGNPIIDGQGSGSPLSITIDDVTVDGFSLKNSGSSPYASAIKISSNRNSIVNNTIMDNQYGVYLIPPSEGNTLLYNRIFNNSRCGISIQNSLNTEVQSNIIVNNGIGIAVETSRFLSFTENIVSYNTGDAINVKLSHNNHIDNNIVMNNRGSGLFLSHGGQNHIDENIIGKNTGTGIETRDFIDDSLRGNQIISALDNFNLNFIANNTVNNNKGNGVFANRSNTLIEDNEIGYNNYGIYSKNSQNLVRDNILKGNSFGIDLLNSGNSTLFQNTLENNVNGIRVDGRSGDNEIISNSINNNRMNGLTLVKSTNGNIMKDNIITNNTGIGLWDLGKNIMGNNFIVNNTPNEKKF